MKVFIGADHRGFDYKKKIIASLARRSDLQILDVGTNTSEQSCDYPQIAYQVARQVAKNKNSRGILVCMSGNGQVIAANKIKGAYAALCINTEAAQLARGHNNANILVVGAKFTKKNELPKIIQTFLTAPFEGGRHLRRFNQIKKIEKGQKV